MTSTLISAGPPMVRKWIWSTGLDPDQFLVGGTTTMLNRIRTNRNDEGASAVEYGLLVALIAVIIAGVVFGLGTALKTKFQTTSTCVAGASAANCP